MVEFQATFSKLSLDCQTLTITDTSNYGYSNNDEHYTIETFGSRYFTIRDIFGNILSVQTMSSTQTSITFDISNLLSTTPLYLSIQLILVMAVGQGSYQTQVSGLLPCIL